MRGLTIRRAAALAVGVASITGVAVTGTTIATAQSSYPACRTSQLTIWRGEPGDGAAGSFYYELQFSNTSKTTCSLYGFPGVAAVNSHGAQLGSPARRDHRFAPTKVMLAPGVTTHAVLRIADVSNYPPTTCQPTTAAALRIIPPNRSAASILSFRFRVCAKTGTVYLYVRTIRPRAGIPGYSQ